MSHHSLVKLHTIVLAQKDLQKAVAFYQLLGLQCTLYKTGQWAEFMLDKVRLALCPSDNLNDNHTGLVFAVADVLAIAQLLKKEGFVVTDPIETGQGVLVTATDPGGNHIDLLYPQVQIRPCPQEESCCRRK